ncbi:sulfotransferase [Geminocystis sp. GBBB08]|uniref:sulfotransferase family protein n=1 Tax=Geminocystis sp. GBBB08 TaxID=2604140 RepID=UPI0027E2D77D|nr:sulfotransferase [Geminocystis sp. GBBB08]MBL1208675.1 chromosome partitioning protein ParA [Geminocystis sp. GBBB08]
MAYSQQPILILTGMHRSGTSLLSSLLQSAGVNIGKKLIPANEGNPKGYFENADFVNFHESILFSLGINSIGWTTQEKIVPPLTYVEEARRLIEENQDFENPWGWKEPRTSLFLDFWSDLLPSAYFIFVYRSPWEVIDSLYRRGDDIFHHNPELALQVWSTYNRLILNFYNLHQEKCLLINLETVIKNPQILAQIIQEKFGISLSAIDSSLYDNSALKRDVKKSQRRHLIKVYFPEIWQQYQELNIISGFENSWLDDIDNLSSNSWALQDWLDLRLLNKKLKQEKESSDQHLHSLYQELGEITGKKEATEFQLSQSQIQLEETKSQLSQSQIQLEETKSQLSQSQIQLEETKSQLEETKSQLSQSQIQLEETKSQLSQSQIQLEETKSHLSQSQIQLKELQQELNNHQVQLQKSQLDFKQLHFYFDRSQEELKQTQQQLKEIEANFTQKEEELKNCQEEIISMKTSKFWRMRNQWFKIKGSFGMVKE